MSSEQQPLKSTNSSHDGYDAQSYNCNGGSTSPINQTENNITTKEDEEYKISSLDFERVINDYSIKSIREKYNQNHHLAKHYADQKQTAIRWILTILAGLLTGLTSVLLVTCTGTIVKWRARIVYQAGKYILKFCAHMMCTHHCGTDNGGHCVALLICCMICCAHNIVLTFHILSHIISSLVANWDILSSKAMIFQTFLWTNLILALASSMLCVYWMPSAAGSGIPEVKAYLNGVRSMQRLANLPMLLVKILGTILSVSCLLSVGQEGPLLHIGAIIGASCSKISTLCSRLLVRLQRRRKKREKQQNEVENTEIPWIENVLCRMRNELSYFATDAERRDLVSIGSSVGLAASFGAPIGALLFIIDDISSYFERNLLLRLLVANAIGVFTLAAWRGDLSNCSIINLGTYGTDDLFINRLDQLPYFIMIGIGGGILGGAFCSGYKWLRRNVTSRFPLVGQGRDKYQLLEVTLVSIITSVVLFYMPLSSYACRDLQVDKTKDYLMNVYNGNEDAADEALIKTIEMGSYLCPSGQINMMARTMFGSRIIAIRHILTDPSVYQQETLLAIGIVFYILSLITSGITIPAGIFTPIILVGAAFGGAIGNAVHHYVDEETTPSTFALLGVAAMLAGVQQSTISVAMMLVEGTGQIKILTPVILVVIIARGIFELVISYKQYPYLNGALRNLNIVSGYYEAVQVRDIMSHPLQTVAPKERVVDLVKLLNSSCHEGYPVVDQSTGRFLGLVKRTQIGALLECGVFSKNYNMSGEDDLTVTAYYGVKRDVLNHVAYMINDDRFDHLLKIPREINPAELSKINERCGSNEDMSMQLNLDDGTIDETSTHETHLMLTKDEQQENRLVRMSLAPTSDRSSFAPPFVQISRNNRGCLDVEWHNTEFNNYWVDVGSVANKGTYTVPDFCPVSKVRRK